VTPQPERAFRLAFHGLFVPVRFTVNTEQEAALLATEGRTPDPVPLLAMIDTGSNRTAVPPGTFARLGVEPMTDDRIEVAGGQSLRLPAYRGRLLFAGRGGEVVEVPATAVEMSLGTRLECIVGRDTLQHGRLAYDGREGVCGLTLKGVDIALHEPPSEPA